MKYQEQAKINLEEFLYKEEYSDRKKILLHIAREFNSRNIKWCLTCSSTLFFRGITTSFHDFDILIDWKDISESIAVVKSMDAKDLPKGNQTLFASTLFNKYQVGNVKFDLFAEWRMLDMFKFEYCYRPEDVEKFTIESTEIAMVSARVQYVLYSVFGAWYPRRLQQAESVQKYLLDSTSTNDVKL